MSGQAVWKVTMTLLSDAIFGSGYSIPGGEDIAVCQDAKGYPYVKGTTVKGLLRESLENLIAWTDGDPGLTDTLFGREDWTGAEDGRRLHFTALTLLDPPSDPQDCYGERTFTSLEDGIVKTGTLRIAACVRKGIRFSGEIACSSQDAELVRDALLGIKWAGTMRSRGFGRICVRAEKMENRAVGFTAPAGRCIHYRLHTESAVQITDLGRSRDNSYETQGFIPGTTVRGMVAGLLAANDPEWFAANKAALLSETTRFLDAVPNPRHLDALPSIKGFYENKDETVFENVVINGSFTSGFKRAKTGAFCALEDGRLCYWSARTEGSTRIRRKTADEDSRMFQTRYISAGQDFDGYILLDDSAVGDKIAEMLPQTVWLGADRYAGLGKCRITLLEPVDMPGWVDAYGYREQAELGTKLYLLALSPLTMLDGCGTPCGLDEARLAQKLGVESAEIRFCSTSLTEPGGYNRTWQCRPPAVRMYDRGSLFQIVCGRAPELAAIRQMQWEGIGIRRSEGFGQVLFLKSELFEGLTQKAAVRENMEGGAACAPQLRRARYTWVMDRAAEVKRCGLSKSQIGTVQALCEKAMASHDRRELDAYLQKNLETRGAKHGERFQKISQLVQVVLAQPLKDTLNVPECEDSLSLRLGLLCMLFDHSRKESDGKEAY